MLNDYTHITLVSDRSGSMEIIRDDAEGGINAFIKANKEAPGICTFSHYEFDTEYSTVFGPGDIKKAKKYKLVPRGGTALLDAQYRAINETGEYLASLPEDKRPNKVIFLTVTDGEENSSQILVGPEGYETLKNKISEQTHIYKWEFAYIGANQDAFAVGHAMGYSNTTSYKGTGASTTNMYANVTNSTLLARSAGVAMASTLASSVDADGNLTFANEEEQEEESV